MSDAHRSLRGQLLVAVPKLLDPNFHQTVTLMIAHDEQHALGLVLNRPSQTKLREAWEQVEGGSCPMDGFLHVGGPCQQVLSALHGDAAWANMEVMPGLYFTQEAEKLRHLVEVQSVPIRFFVGFAGWGPGQLESELREGAWLIAPASIDGVFADPAQLWERLSRKLGGASAASLLGIKNPPPNPSLN